MAAINSPASSHISELTQHETTPVNNDSQHQAAAPLQEKTEPQKNADLQHQKTSSNNARFRLFNHMPSMESVKKHLTMSNISLAAAAGATVASSFAATSAVGAVGTLAVTAGAGAPVAAAEGVASGTAATVAGILTAVSIGTGFLAGMPSGDNKQDTPPAEKPD